MALVTAILSNRDDLAATARRVTGDTNEASLLVGTVITRAFTKFDHDTSADAIAQTLRYDLYRLIAAQRLS